MIRLTAPFLPPFNIVLGDSSFNPGPEDILWFEEWRALFARRWLLDESNHQDYINISSDEEEYMGSNSPEINDSSGTEKEDSVESTFVTGILNSRENQGVHAIQQELVESDRLSPPSGFEGMREYPLNSFVQNEPRVGAQHEWECLVPQFLNGRNGWSARP